MSRHHANTTNPKFLQRQKEYMTLTSDFGARSPFLMHLIERTRKTKPVGPRRFGYAEAEELIGVFDETGLTERLRSDADVQDPAVFWTAMDCAKARQHASGNSRAIRALVFLYENMDKNEVFTDDFKRAEKSPYAFLRKNSFLDRLCTEYTCADDVYFINYSSIHLPVMLVLPYNNRFLRTLVVDAFGRSQSTNVTTKSDSRELCAMEEVFGPFAETIHNIFDLNAEVFAYAKDYIMRKYEDERLRAKSMRLLWDIFRHAVLSHPEHDFFKNSHLWNATLIINHRVPSQVAMGYVPVIVESYGSIPAYDKVLYVYTNGEYFGANGVTYGMFAVTFSGIKNENYRWLAVNFIAATDQRRHPIVSSFLCWIEERKVRPGYKYGRMNWLYMDELCSYRNVISGKTRNAASRNVYITTLTGFIRWAAGTGRIHLQKGVFKYFGLFKCRYKPKPRSLVTCRIKALKSAFHALAENEPRFLIIDVIFDILLRSDIRAGQLCSLDLERVTWNENGTSTYLSRVKNRGDGMVVTTFSRRCTELLREAERLTDEIRKECPVGGPETCLFLYRGIRKHDDRFAVMNIQRLNEDLRAACEKAGIPYVTTGNIRDTRMTAVTKFAHRHNLNDAQIATLTKHAQRTSLNSYVDLHIEDLLYAADDINLGIID